MCTNHFDIIVYVFVGCLLLSGHALRYVAGSLVILVGVGYIVLEFIPSIEPPANMRPQGLEGIGDEETV